MSRKFSAAKPKIKWYSVALHINTFQLCGLQQEQILLSHTSPQ